MTITNDLKGKILLASLTLGIIGCNNNTLKNYKDYFPKDAVESQNLPQYTVNDKFIDKYLKSDERSNTSNTYYFLANGNEQGDTTVYVDIISKSPQMDLDSIDAVLFKGKNAEVFTIFEPPAKNNLQKITLVFGQAAYKKYTEEIKEYNHYKTNNTIGGK